MRLRVALAAAFLSAALSGCSLGLHSTTPQIQTYVLKALPTGGSAAGTPTQTPALSASIQITRPQTAPGLESERIAILTSDHKGDYYAGAQWAGALPDVTESLVIERLRTSGRWAAVQSSRSAFPADYLLQLRIRRFDADYAAPDAAPDILVAIDCTLGRRVDREVLASFSVTGAAKADANRLGAVVAAFETAANLALDQIDAQASAAVQNVPSPVDSSRR